MRFVPAVAAAAAVLTIETSALPVPVVATDDVLLPGFVSVLVAVTLAVFPIAAPAAPGLTWTVIEKVADVRPSDAIVQVTVPVPPGGGLVHAKAGPVDCDSETNVVFAGTASVSETLAAFDGPLFVTTIV